MQLPYRWIRADVWVMYTWDDCVCAASVLSLGVCENRDGWLVAWGFCG